MKLNSVAGSPSPTHYVFCVDVSGSMSRSLTTIRAELKNKLASIIKPADLLTIIWFSGKGDAGYVFKHLSVANAKQLQEIHDGIDRWLKADCLTAFDKPIRLAGEAVVESMSNSFIFCTDGYVNDVPKSAVMSELEKIKGRFSAYSFIEYGTYCDSRFIAEMAQIVGGSQSLKESVTDLMAEVETQLSVAAAPRIEIQVPKNCTHVFGFDGESLIVYPVTEEVALVNASTIHFVPFFADFQEVLDRTVNVMNCLISALGCAMLNNWKEAERYIAAIGDEDLLNSLGGAYGIQKIEGFKILLLEAIKGNVSLSPTEGATIDENAFCVFDLLELLTTTKGNYLLPDHEAFNYKRIGLAKTAKVAEDVKEASSAADFLGIDAPVKPIEFKKLAGQEISLEKLTLNTERANVSLFATYKGTVVNLPANEFGINEYDTVQHRNYTVIQDGRLNVTHLPVRLGIEFWRALTLEQANNLFSHVDTSAISVIDLTKIPIINRRRINDLNARDAASKAFELLKVRAALKVIKTLRPDTYNQVEGVAPEVAEFLKSIGITSQGFSPKVETADASDFYYAPELTFSFAGASALPSVVKVKEKLQKIADWYANPKGKEPKLNLAEKLMVQALKVAEVITEGTATEFAAKVNKKKRGLECDLSGIVSTLILSRGWFADKADFDDNQVTLDVPEIGQVDCTINFRDIEVKI